MWPDGLNTEIQKYIKLMTGNSEEATRAANLELKLYHTDREIRKINLNISKHL